MAPWEDLFPLRRFRLELDGVAQGAFDEFDPPALVTAVEVDEHGRRRPGSTSRTHARLLRGHANTRELHEWFGAVLHGGPMRRAAVVVELDEQGEESVRHELGAAWPVRLKLATLTPELLSEVEELDLAVEGWRLGAAEPAPAPAGPEPTAVEPAPAEPPPVEPAAAEPAPPGAPAAPQKPPQP